MRFFRRPTFDVWDLTRIAGLVSCFTIASIAPMVPKCTLVWFDEAGVDVSIVKEGAGSGEPPKVNFQTEVVLNRLLY